MKNSDSRHSTSDGHKGVTDADRRRDLYRSPSKFVPIVTSRRKELIARLRNSISEGFQFWSVTAVQLLGVLYILAVTFMPRPFGLADPVTGLVVDGTNSAASGILVYNGVDRPIVAADTLQMVCLGLSRTAAAASLPVLVLAFFSKCKATLNFLSGTRVNMYMFQDMHRLHSFCGHFLVYEALIHVVLHLVRWAEQGNISLLWTHRTGLSGLVVIVVTPLITLPMVYFKKRIPYEIRKGLHWLFYLFAVGMCFHVPTAAFPNGGFCTYVMGTCIVFYTLDRLYVEAFMTEKIEVSRKLAKPFLHCGRGVAGYETPRARLNANRTPAQCMEGIYVS